jgi:hypothetical protein
MASRKIEDCVEELQEKVPLIIKDYNALFPERSLRVICSLRSIEEQKILYAKGRTAPPFGKRYQVTQVDGVNVFSAHNPWPDSPLAKAVDFGVFIGGKYQTAGVFYHPLLDLARKYNLVSGYDFDKTGAPLPIILKDGKFHDGPHVQIDIPLYRKK